MWVSGSSECRRLTFLLFFKFLHFFERPLVSPRPPPRNRAMRQQLLLLVHEGLRVIAPAVLAGRSCCS